MKMYRTAALAVSLLAACAANAGAVTFMPVLSGSPAAPGKAPGAGLAPGQGLMAPARLRVSIVASAWDLPDADVAVITGTQGDRVRFVPQIAPVVMAEYRLTPRFGVGGWFAPMTTDARFRGPTAEQLRDQGQPGSGTIASKAMNMWNAHASMHFRGNTAVVLGVMRYRGTVSAVVPNPNAAASPSQPVSYTLNAGLGGTEVHAWVYKSLPIWKYTNRPAFFTGGLGVRQRVANPEPTMGPQTAGEASLAFTYYPRPNFSVDASAWLADVTDNDAASVRGSFGVTGHF